MHPQGPAKKKQQIVAWQLMNYKHPLVQQNNVDRVKRIWYLSPMRAAKVQASLRIRAVSPEPPLLAHTSSESRGTFRQKARSLAPLNGWACAVKICHDGMLEDANSLDGDHVESAMCKKLTCLVSNESQEAFQTDQGQHCPRSAWKVLDRGQPTRVQVQKR